MKNYLICWCISFTKYEIISLTEFCSQIFLIPLTKCLPNCSVIVTPVVKHSSIHDAKEPVCVVSSQIGNRCAQPNMDFTKNNGSEKIEFIIN